MRKLGIYFVVCTLVVSLCPIHPITTYANEGESEEEQSEELLLEEENKLSKDVSSKKVDYDEEEIVLFAEESDKEIEFFEDVPKQDEEAFLMIPDETEAILLISEDKEQKDSEEIDYAFIQYTYIDEKSDNQEEVTIEGYVHIDHVVLADEALAFKNDRDAEEIIDEKESNSEHENDSDVSNGKIDKENADAEGQDTEDNVDKNIEKEPIEAESNSSNDDIIADSDDETSRENKEEQLETEKKDSSTVSKKQSSTQLLATSVLKKGDRTAEVIQLKKDLAKLGFKVPGNGTNYFGVETEKKVKEFQKYYNLSQTGTVNTATRSKINNQVNSPFQLGKRHNDTLQLKRNLNKAGFGGITVTTLYGDYTVKKVKEFQKAHGLKVTGIADEVTRAKLASIVNNSFEKGDSHNDIIQIKKNLNKIGFGGITVTSFYGDFTVKRVKEFQEYYNLKVTGIADEITIAKINSIANSPFQKGKSHNDTLQLKKDLNKIGFGGITVTSFYGDFTVKRVKEFQEYYNLKVTGIVDEITRSRINATANSPYQNGKRHNNTLQLKRDLNKIGFGGITVTTLFSDFTEKRVREFQEYYGLKVTGIADDITRNKIKEVADSPFQNGNRHNDTLQLKKDLNKIGFGGITVTTLYSDFTEKRVREFQEYYGLKVTGIADQKTRAAIKSVADSPFQNGNRHNDTLQLKRDLNKIGFGGITVTTLYSDFTEKRVREFQEYYGLKVTGIADDITRKKIKEVADSPFQNGNRHNDTLQLKKDLNKIGFGGITVTTLYSDFTEKRVREFQDYYGLKVTGIADDITRKKIKEVADSPFQNGNRHNDTLQLKKDLNKIGFGGITVTTLFSDFTEKRVKEFQKYYGLKVTGIADEKTLEKLNSIVNHPLQKGKRHNDTIQLKIDLAKIGYPVPGNGTNLYGTETEKQIRNLQRDHNLAVSGIAEEVTLSKIADLVKNGGSNPNPINKTEYTDYKLTLNQAVDIQLNQSAPMTDKYRNDPAYVSANYLRLTGSAKISGSKVNIRTAPNTTGTIAFQYTAGTSITITGTATGTSISGSTLWYKISQNGKTYYIHSSLASGAQAEVTGTVNVRAGKGSSYHSFGKLQKGERVNIITQGPSWHEISYNAWREPTRADVKSYLDPSNNDKFQHLRLDSSVGVSASELNKVLSGKGILEDQGQAFINGANKHGVNEAYLIAHALLETGNGTSTLATGVQYNGKTVYNMFGIGAVDSNPINGGAKTAYENGWFTPAAAIEGGAKWIGQDYIYNAYNQNTLYKIRWNPRMSEGYAWKQYATDIGWAHKQVTQIKNIYNQLDNPSYHYDIPRYK